MTSTGGSTSLLKQVANVHAMGGVQQGELGLHVSQGCERVRGFLHFIAVRKCLCAIFCGL
eukprot:745638-Pleurochrysis_carterae.AAC.1